MLRNIYNFSKTNKKIFFMFYHFYKDIKKEFAMQVQQISNQNFGALSCYPSVKDVQSYIARRMSVDAAIKCDEYLSKLNQNKELAEVSLNEEFDKSKLLVEIADKTFKEGWLNSPLRILKKALKISDELEKK